MYLLVEENVERPLPTALTFYIRITLMLTTASSTWGGTL